MPSLDASDDRAPRNVPMVALDPPLSWAETRALIRRDFARLVQMMGMPPTLSRRIFWFLLPAYQGIFWFRIYRYAYLRGWRTLANLLFLICQYLTHVDIPPSTSIGGGCLLGHPPIVLCGRIGENFTLFGHGGMGGGMDTDDIGAGPGLPVVGDNVSMSIRATILGPVRIGDGARLGPACTVMRDVPAGAFAVAPASRITRAEVAAADTEETKGSTA